MTKISCGVSSCVYNKFHSCLKENIMIGDNSANLKKETFCSSYKERQVSDYKAEFANIDFPVLMKVNVKCQAKNCRFNETNRCLKDTIKIEQNFHLGKVHTKCISFEK